jgi:hypothetical protein
MSPLATGRRRFPSQLRIDRRRPFPDLRPWVAQSRLLLSSRSSHWPFHEPGPLRQLPIGRGRGVAADVPGNLDADCPTETVEVRVDQGSTERLLAPQRDRPPVSERLLCTRGAIVLAKEAQGLDHDLNSLGNLGNVG